MKEIYVWPVGRAVLVHSIRNIPTPYEFIGAFDGYRFFNTAVGKYAIKE